LVILQLMIGSSMDIERIKLKEISKYKKLVIESKSRYNSFNLTQKMIIIFKLSFIYIREMLNCYLILLWNWFEMNLIKII
jgi:hypothetical protein